MKESQSLFLIFLFVLLPRFWAQGQCGNSAALTLVASDGTHLDGFGRTMDLDGDVLVIGAPWSGHRFENFRSGSAYVFRKINNEWQEEQKLLPPLADIRPYGFFGGQVSISGNRICTSSRYSENEPRRVYVFEFDGSNWSIQANLVAPDDSGPLYGGCWLQGDKAFVGGSSNNRIHEFQHNQSGWKKIRTIIPSIAPSTDTIHSLALEYERMAVTTPTHAFVFRFTGTEWLEEIAFNEPNGSFFWPGTSEQSPCCFSRSRVRHPSWQDTLLPVS